MKEVFFEKQCTYWKSSEFVKEINHSNITYVLQAFLLKEIRISIKSVHGRKKLFKCNICDASFYQKGQLNGNIASVH